jgi:pimeloyl-ACP methyl ester carboxylesterase
MFVVLLVIVLLIGLAVFYTQKIDKSIESQFSPPGKLTTVNGGVIHWQVSGSGPAIILVHGLLGNSRNFYELASILAQHYTVYSVDRPGSGFSSRMTSTPSTFEKQSQMLLEWMDKENISEAALVGHSMGGGISLRMALDAPQKIRAVTLICPLTTMLKGGAGPLSMLYIPNHTARRAVSKTIASPLRVAMGRKQIAQIFFPEPVPEDFAITGGGLLSLHSRHFYEGSRDTVSAQGSLHRQSSMYGNITCPVGVLYGGQDVILNPKEHIQAVVDKLPSARTHIVAEAGHMLPMTQPALCANFIEEVLFDSEDACA